MLEVTLKSVKNNLPSGSHAELYHYKGEEAWPTVHNKGWEVSNPGPFRSEPHAERHYRRQASMNRSMQGTVLELEQPPRLPAVAYRTPSLRPLGDGKVRHTPGMCAHTRSYSVEFQGH